MSSHTLPSDGQTILKTQSSKSPKTSRRLRIGRIVLIQNGQIRQTPEVSEVGVKKDTKEDSK